MKRPSKYGQAIMRAMEAKDREALATAVLDQARGTILSDRYRHRLPAGLDADDVI